MESQITNGIQTAEESCNPTPMGQLPSSSAMPSAKFSSPRNGQVVQENQLINVVFAGTSLNAQDLTNPATNFLAAPQSLNSEGLINGHYNLVVDQLFSFDQPILTDPTKFAFFKVVSDPTIPTQISSGLSAGFYRASITIHASNHQPVLVPVGQHGLLGDAVYVRSSFP